MTQNILLYTVHYLSVVNISWLRAGLHLKKAEGYCSSPSTMSFIIHRTGSTIRHLTHTETFEEGANLAKYFGLPEQKII